MAIFRRRIWPTTPRMRGSRYCATRARTRCWQGDIARSVHPVHDRHMTNRSYAEELESAADRIGDMSLPDLQIMLRRTALRFRNSAPVPLDPEWEDALQSVAGELGMTRNDLIRHIVKDWLIANSYLPVSMLDEESETEGSG